MFYKLKTLWQCFTKDKYVFFDINEASLALAKDIVKHKRGAVLFLKDKPLKKRLLKNKTYLFFLSEHDDANIQSVLSFFTTWKRDEFKKVQHNLELIVRIQNELMYPVVENYIKSAPFKISYTLFNDSELIASELVKKFHPIDTLNVNTQNATVNDIYEALIVGFDVTGNSILRKLIEATQFVGTQFKTTVMANDAITSLGCFLNHYPEMKKHYAIDFLNYEMGSDDFSAWLCQHVTTLKQIIISTGNDEKNIAIASELNLFLKNRDIHNIPIIIVVRSNEPTFWEQANEYSLMHCVGKSEAIFTESKVLKLDYLHQAKAIHQFYNQLKPFAQRIPWEQLSDIKKESNIAVSESLYAKLKLMGKTADEVKEMSEIQFQLFLQEHPERLLNLAIAEHLRWNATYFAHGWRTWHLSEIPEDAPHQDETKKLHACLVDWSTLKELEKRFDVPFQIYDYNNIMIMRSLLANNILAS
ncbi:MAG: hypothetical protein FWC34_11775 [Bacteroidetes bacterium]|nr:hypothetical protein [Bacteroidota bacterium]MCL2302093.1 hypothetical protein [Lentimicrobiaceae bacterium]